MRIALAGGNGYIGRALTDELLAAGHEVAWLSHRPGHVNPPAGVLEVAFDPAEKHGPWREQIHSADGVVNLSGYPIASRWDARVKQLLVSSRIDTARALVDAIGEARSGGRRPSVYVGACGIGIYSDGGEKVLAEDAPTGGEWLADLAVAWENEALRASELGCRVVVVRTGLILGSEGLLPRLKLPMLLFAGGPVGSGRQWMPWVHEADIAGIYRFAIETESLSGPVNACAPNPVRSSEFARALGRVLHRPSWFPVPGFVLRLVLGEVAPYTLFGQRATSAKIEQAGYAFRHPELEESLRDLLGR